MSAFSLSLKQFARRVTRSATYENASSEPCFLVQAIVVNGVPIDGITLQDAKVVLSEVLNSEDALDRTNVNLLISSVEGVQILGRDGRELVRYGLPDIAFGGIDADHPEYLVIVGSTGKSIKCHIYHCGDAARSKMILICLNKSFQKGKDIFGTNEDNNGQYEDVFATQESTSNPRQSYGYSKGLDNTTKNSTRPPVNTESVDSKGFFSRLAPRSYSDASALKQSRLRLRSRDRTSSYSKLEDF